jgi:hypothetical protein
MFGGRADDGDLPAGASEGGRFLPDAAVERHGKIFDDDDAGAPWLASRGESRRRLRVMRRI